MYALRTNILPFLNATIIWLRLRRAVLIPVYP
jgi:hypothetical protein